MEKTKTKLTLWKRLARKNAAGYQMLASFEAKMKTFHVVRRSRRECRNHVLTGTYEKCMGHHWLPLRRL